MDTDVDPAFALLPAYLRKQIDRAMDAVLSEGIDNGRPGPSKLSYVNESSSKLPTPGGFVVENTLQPGGFVAEDEGTALGGGFIPEEDTAMGSEAGGFIPSTRNKTQTDEYKSLNDQIPLRLIPQALQLLDLQPDDADVLEVFRNAASGWEDTANFGRSSEEQSEEHFVSRRDWRAVCAALLDTSGNEDDDSRDNDVQMGEDEDEVDEDEGSEVSAEEYVDSDDERSEESSGDDYQEGGFVRSKPSPQSSRRTQTTRRSYSLSSSADGEATQQTRITVRQKAECRKTFALFFPGVPDSDLDGKRVMIRDIATVADILKEKISTEEVGCAALHLTWRLNEMNRLLKCSKPFPRSLTNL